MAASGQVPSAPAAGSKAASKQGNTPAPVSHTLPDFVALDPQAAFAQTNAADATLFGNAYDFGVGADSDADVSDSDDDYD